MAGFTAVCHLTVALLIRPVVADDVAAICDIDAQASAFPWTPAQFQQIAEADAGRGQGLLIEWASVVSGFVIFNLVLDEGNIHNVAVHPNRQRLGLASQLLVQALKLMKQKNVERCFLDVRRSNAAAIALYTGLGFELDGVRKNYYRCSGGREDALLMSKFL